MTANKLEGKARELLAEAECGPICDYGTVHRRVAHAAIQRGIEYGRALDTARQSEGMVMDESLLRRLRAAKFDIEKGVDGLWRIAGTREAMVDLGLFIRAANAAAAPADAGEVDRGRE